MNIILGVTGSIAAYKAADIINKLKPNHNVTVVMSTSATKFITPLTLQTLSGNKVYIDTFDDEDANVSHIDLALNADLILIAPATANIISKYCYGICDDLLSTILTVVSHNKVMIAPAMNTNMLTNPTISENIERLSQKNVSFIEPRESLLACNVYGTGALATVETICQAVESYEVN